jgi:hypothetical protein
MTLSLFLRVYFITTGAGQEILESIRSFVGIKATMRRIFFLLHKFNEDGAEVLSRSITVRNTGNQENKE